MKSIRIAYIAGLLLLSFCAMAQPGPPPPPGDGDAPIGGIEILLVAGAALGIKKLYKKEK